MKNFKPTDTPLKWKFGNKEFAVRIQCFDPFLFTNKFVGKTKWKTHLISGKLMILLFLLTRAA